MNKIRISILSILFLIPVFVQGQKYRFNERYDVFWEYSAFSNKLTISGNDTWVGDFEHRNDYYERAPSYYGRNNPWYESNYGTLRNREVLRIVIETGVNNIPSCTFGHFKRLEKVILPEGFTTIGDRSFIYCERLEEIKIPTSVVHIGRCAFYRCLVLSTIGSPMGLEKIGSEAFRYTGLKSVQLPYKIIFECDDVGASYAFADCPKLERVTICPINPAPGLFSNCHHLKYVEFLDGSFLGKNMFSWCRKLDTIVFHSKVKNIPPLFGDRKPEHSTPVTVIVPDGTLRSFQRMARKDKINKEMLHFVEISNTNKPKPLTIQNRPVQPVVTPPIAVVPGKSETDEDIPVSWRSSPNTYAFIIANENYPLKEVPFALNDGRIFAQYCTKTLGIDEKHVIMYENATTSNIIECVELMKKASNANSGKINILFYYAGHAFPDEATGSPYILPVDGSISLPRTCYSLNQLYSEMKELQANSVVCFIDACFSGATRENGTLLTGRGPKRNVPDVTPMGNVVVFSASQAAETAHQYYEKSHGMFTYFLLKKLQDTRGRVTLGELSDYVIEQVSKTSFDENKKVQTPKIIPSPKLQSTWQNIRL